MHMISTLINSQMMLALPVERLVGGNTHNSSRMSLSPDSNVSDNSSSESTHSSRKSHHHHHQNRGSLSPPNSNYSQKSKISSPAPQPPLPLPSPPCSEADCNCTSAEGYHDNTDAFTTKRKRSRSRSQSPRNMNTKIKIKEPFSPPEEGMGNTMRVKVKEESDMDEGLSKGETTFPYSLSTRMNSNPGNNGDNGRKSDKFDGECANRDNRKFSDNDNNTSMMKSNCRVAHFNFHQGTDGIRKTSGINRDHRVSDDDMELNVDGDDDQDQEEAINGNNSSRRISHHHHHQHPILNHFTSYRPPSVASNASSSSNLTCSSQKSPFGFNTPRTSQSQSSHKFSIEDILRPDFGVATSPKPPKSHQSRINSTLNRKELLSPPYHPQRRTGSVSSSEGHRPYRPSSCHSEDSTGSSRNREPEVVDDTKVNPPVPEGPLLWPAWVYCTRYSDRPSSGPRSRRIRKSPREIPEEKRPRTAFTAEQLARLKKEFEENRYLTEKRRQDLARDLKLHENQIKIWFQNKRAKLKKSTGTKNGLALQLIAQGLYNHSTVPVDEDDEMEMMM